MFLRVSNFCRQLATSCSPDNTEAQHDSSGRQQSEIVRIRRLADRRGSFGFTVGLTAANLCLPSFH